MFKILQLLIFGHFHKWETIRESSLTMGSEVGARYILRCEKCGNIKRKDII